MAGLLGDVLSWIDSRKRIGADNLRGLLSAPLDTAQRIGYQAAEQFDPLVQAAMRGDVAGMLPGLVGNVVKLPERALPVYQVDELPMTPKLFEQFSGSGPIDLAKLRALLEAQSPKRKNR